MIQDVTNKPPTSKNPYYYNLDDPHHIQYQESMLADYEIIDNKNYNTTSHIGFIDEPTTLGKHFFT